MRYIETRFEVRAGDVTLVTDLLAALLADAGYETFVPDDTGVTAYIPADKYDESLLPDIVSEVPVAGEISFDSRPIADKDWNEEWEKNYFRPIVVGSECVIHSTFHTDVPAARYDIVIDPKMAFGTGHHETTSLMLESMLSCDFTGKEVLDMGCGTAILAILASMRGARRVTAIDIDEWAAENAAENIRLNHIKNIDVWQGGAERLDGSRTFDIVLANINRNIHLENMAAYAAVMKPDAAIYMSGFYTADLPLLQAEAARYSLHFRSHREKNNWAVALFVKA